MKIVSSSKMLFIGSKSVQKSNILFVDYDNRFAYLIMSGRQTNNMNDGNGLAIDFTAIDYPLQFTSAELLARYITKLINEDINTIPWYGVEFDQTSTDPAVTRIAQTGCMDMHASLPIQSKMRRCVIDGTTGDLKYYLDANDSTLKEDGVTPAVLDGTDGQVMVELPEHYRACIIDGDIARIMISEYPIAGGVVVPKMYISAYEPTLDRTDPALFKLASVVNDTAAFRGGDNDNTLDETFKSLLGRPTSNFTIDGFRRYASNRNNGDPAWNAYLYEAHKAIYWLYVIEYANRNSQQAINYDLTFDGYKQGGLGDGVTNFDKWDVNNYQPFIPCGITNSLGNNTGQVAWVPPAGYLSELTDLSVISYRGIENVFGHLAKWTDGIHTTGVMVGEDQKVKVMVCDDPEKFQDVNNAGYEQRGDLVTGSDGYGSKQVLGEGAEILASEFNGSESTGICDYCSTYGSVDSIYVVLLSGGADFGASAGLGYANVESDPSYSYSHFGSRLCYKSMGAQAPRRALLLAEEPEV